VTEISVMETIARHSYIEQVTSAQFTATETRPTRGQEDLLAILLDAAGAAGAQSHPQVPTATFNSPALKTSELFYVDTAPQVSHGPAPSLQTPLYKPLNVPVMGEMDDEDEIILVPSPAARRAPSIASISTVKDQAKSPQVVVPPLPVTMETLSLSFSKPDETKGIRNKSLKSFSVPKSGRSPFIPLRARKEAKRRVRKDSWTNDLGNVFGFKDGREGLRQGDSDLDVGSGSEKDEPESNGMDVDPDLDAAAMARFAREVNKPHMSMDDVVIEAALQNGDYDSGSSEDDEEAMEVTAAIILDQGEEDDEDDEDWSSDDEEDVDMTPTTSFKSRLKRVRERTPAPDEADWAINEAEITWADRDEDFIAGIQACV